VEGDVEIIGTYLGCRSAECQLDYLQTDMVILTILRDYEGYGKGRGEVLHEVMNRCGHLCWNAAIIAEADPSDGTRTAQSMQKLNMNHQ
jgi:hypothetical protein